MSDQVLLVKKLRTANTASDWAISVAGTGHIGVFVSVDNAPGTLDVVLQYADPLSGRFVEIERQTVAAATGVTSYLIFGNGRIAPRFRLATEHASGASYTYGLTFHPIS